MKPICKIKLKYYPLQSYEEEFLSSMSVIIKEEGSEPWLQHIYKYSPKKLNIRLLDMLLLSLAFTYIYIYCYYYYLILLCTIRVILKHLLSSEFPRITHWVFVQTKHFREWYVAIWLWKTLRQLAYTLKLANNCTPDFFNRKKKIQTDLSCEEVKWIDLEISMSDCFS